MICDLYHTGFGLLDYPRCWRTNTIRRACLVQGYLTPNTFIHTSKCQHIQGGMKCASRGTKENSDENGEAQAGSRMWMGQPDSGNSSRGPRYLRVSRSKAADVVVDLLEDEAPVHEGEASLWVNKPRAISWDPWLVELWLPDSSNSHCSQVYALI